MTKLLILTAAMIPIMAWKGYVATILWSWFAVDTFGLRPISIYEAVGVIIIWGLQYDYSVKRETRTPSDIILMGFLFPLFALGTGWVWRALFSPG
jgi:hypothetical protein